MNNKIILPLKYELSNEIGIQEALFKLKHM